MGWGLAPAQVDRVIGVVKAFQTRVGAGPFPTELEGPTALRLRGTGSQPWDEFGTTTGRPRRVGWLDLVLLRYTARINGLTELVVTKLDVLSGLPKVKICVAYRKRADPSGKLYRDLPMGIADLAPYEPVYEELPGWQEPLGAVRAWNDLPGAAQEYIRRLVEVCGVPVHFGFGWPRTRPGGERVSFARWLRGFFLVLCLVALAGCLPDTPSPTPLPPTATVTITPTGTATIVWFPPTATFTPAPTRYYIAHP